MRYTSSSWFPLKNFCNGKCHFDYMMGVCKWHGVKDALTGTIIRPMETVFWNRTLGNITIGLQNYLKVRKDPLYADKMKSLELPDNIKV